MKVPFSWLKEFVALKAGADEVARRLTFAGLEVEAVQESEGDHVLEINVTPNRGDCLSILGIAREVSALFKIPLKKGAVSIAKPTEQDPTLKKAVVLKASKQCPRYRLAAMEGVTIGPSPAWLIKRLEQVGIRSINNVVDVTNYVLIAYGQPLHAFDRRKIRGGKILVRTGHKGEKIKTLDGQELELQAPDLVIADAEGAIALAGIMGGKDSEVGERTTSIALECAFFDPEGIRKTARRLGLQTESSYRFERRVDPQGLSHALNAAVSLILKVAGGRLLGPVLDVGPGDRRTATVALQPSQVSACLGGSWDAKTINQTLSRLAFGVKERGKSWSITVPSHRGDITRAVDVIEEVARVTGYDRIPTVFPPLVAKPPREARGFQLARRVKTTLVDLGLREMIHYSFLSPDEVRGLRGFDPQETQDVFLQNPLGREYSLMRPSLLPQLLKTTAHHQNHKIHHVRAFEFRSCFSLTGGQVLETKMLAGILSGSKLLTHWGARAEETDFYDAKGLVERILDVAGVTAAYEPGSTHYLHPRKQAVLKRQGRTLGVLGEIHPDLASAYDLKKTAYVFEIDWGRVSDAPEKGDKTYQEYARTPVVERDLALVLDDAVPAGALQDFLRSGDPTIQEVGVFDLYRGNPIPQGKKSLAFSIRMGRADRTLTEDEVNEIYGRLVEGVKKSFNAEVR